MYVSDLALNDFRSYKELVIQLPPGIVVLRGRNGRGKTNLVESILYLSTFASHRVNADRALVRAPLQAGDDKPSAAVIRARVVEGDASERERLLELEIVRGKANRARMNRAPVRPREILGRLRTVMFAPEDVQLLRGDPAGRRRFLDQVVTQVKPSFLGVRRDLNQALRQRGAALKQLGFGASLQVAEDVLAPWDQTVADLSAQICAHRLSLVESLRAAVVGHYADISDDTKPIGIRYELHLAAQERSEFGPKQADVLNTDVQPLEDGYFPDLSALTEDLAKRFAHMIRLRRSSELRRGINLVGAHLDDLSIDIAGLPVKGYASQGETWSAVLALRLAQGDLLTMDGDTPVLILDDVFAELDERRRVALANRVEGVQQVLITAANQGDLPELANPAVFEVHLDEDSRSCVDAIADGEVDAGE